MHTDLCLYGSRSVDVVTNFISRSSDGRLVVISSMDGYCSFVKFDDAELGSKISFDPIEYQVTQAKIRKAANREKVPRLEKTPKAEKTLKTDIESSVKLDDKSKGKVGLVY